MGLVTTFSDRRDLHDIMKMCRGQQHDMFMGEAVDRLLRNSWDAGYRHVAMGTAG